MFKNSREAGTLADDDLVDFVMKICFVREGIASVKIPGGEVKFPCGACKARCVKQQVTLHSCGTTFKHFFKHINLFKMNMIKLQTTNFFLFTECISGDSTPSWFESTANSIFPIFQQHMPDASRIFHQLLVSAGWLHFVASLA